MNLRDLATGHFMQYWNRPQKLSAWEKRRPLTWFLGLKFVDISEERKHTLWLAGGHGNILRPRQNGRRFADDVFKGIFLNENVWISLKISLKFAPKFPINNIPALVQILAWCRSGDKPLSEAMMVSLLTHICVIRPQWGNGWRSLSGIITK